MVLKEIWDDLYKDFKENKTTVIGFGILIGPLILVGVLGHNSYTAIINYIQKASLNNQEVKVGIQSSEAQAARTAQPSQERPNLAAKPAP